MRPIPGTVTDPYMDKHLRSRPSLTDVDQVARDFRLARENYKEASDLFDISPTPETYHEMKIAVDLLAVAKKRLDMVESL